METRRTRLSIYGVALARGSILLCRIAPTYPGEGMWTLPGGGVEWGEHPEGALKREIYEETGLELDAFGFLGIDSGVYEDNRYPDGLHIVRMIYDTPLAGQPRVTEIDGSVDEARWISLTDLADLPTVGLVEAALEFAHPPNGTFRGRERLWRSLGVARATPPGTRNLGTRE